MRSDTWARLPGSYHGSGCTLASAIAAMLANGLDMPEAVREAQDYTWHALKKAYRPGMGQFLPDRLFWAREDDATPGDDAEAQRGVRCPKPALTTRRRGGASAPVGSRGSMRSRPTSPTPRISSPGSRPPSTAARAPSNTGTRSPTQRSSTGRPKRSLACTAAQGALYIVNDDAALCVAVGADGVHLGEDDASVAAARRNRGPGTHHRRVLLRRFRARRSRSGRRRGLCGVRQLLPVGREAGRAARGLRAPRIAPPRSACRSSPSAGSTRTNAASSRARAPHAVAVISAVFDAPDVTGGGARHRGRVSLMCLRRSATFANAERARHESQRRAFRPRAAHDSRRRQFPGARFSIRRRHAALHRARRRRLPVGRRRQALPRLCRILGTGDPRSRASGGRGSRRRSGASRLVVRRADRDGDRDGGDALPPACRRWSWCASSRPAPRRRCRRCGLRAGTPAAARS